MGSVGKQTYKEIMQILRFFENIINKNINKIRAFNIVTAYV